MQNFLFNNLNLVKLSYIQFFVMIKPEKFLKFPRKTRKIS